MVLQADSTYYNREVVPAARRHGVRVSVTARKDRAVIAAIAAIPDDEWTPIRYPRAVFDEQLGQFVSDAEVAGAPFTAFTSKPKAQRVTARLIVRRVRDANPDHVTVNAQGELFRVWRHHAIFTDSPLPMLDAEADHRRHSIIEQVVADLKDGQLAHLPSGDFAASACLPRSHRRMRARARRHERQAQSRRCAVVAQLDTHTARTVLGHDG